jgi:hypothetical protein
MEKRQLILETNFFHIYKRGRSITGVKEKQLVA